MCKRNPVLKKPRVKQKAHEIKYERIQRPKPGICWGTDEETGQTPCCHGYRGPLGKVG